MAARLTADEARTMRLRALLLAGHGFTTPAQVVTWFGAMQAQDVASGHWSFGVRLPGLTEEDVSAATEERQIVRTWPMRGTIHFVPPGDAHWMLEVTGARQLRGLAPRWGRLGIDEAMVRLAAEVLGSALADGGLRTRAECIEVLNAAGLEATGQRAYHYLWWASQTGVTVIGPQRGKDQTFALLDAWAPEPNRPDREEALTILALRYFRSHGPASVKDFAGWTALTMAEARSGVAGAGEALVTVEVAGQPMVLAAAALAANLREVPASDVDEGRGPLVLPGFDEFLLGFKDRSLMADPATMAAVIPGGNGVFRNTVVLDGRVRATWKRSVKAKRVDVAVLPLGGWEPTRAQRAALVAAFYRFGSFLALPVVVAVK